MKILVQGSQKAVQFMSAFTFAALLFHGCIWCLCTGLTEKDTRKIMLEKSVLIIPSPYKTLTARNQFSEWEVHTQNCILYKHLTCDLSRWCIRATAFPAKV